MRSGWATIVGVACGLLGVAGSVAHGQDGSEGVVALIEEADVHLRTKSYGAALKVLEKARKIDGANFEVRWKLGQCYEQLGNPRAALDQYQAAAELRPDDLTVAHRLGVVLLANDRAAEALPHLERVYAADPDADGVRAALGRLYFETGALAKARSFLKKAVRSDRKNPELRYYYGETLFRQAQYADARDEFAVALEHARGKAETNHLVPIVSARQQLSQRRIRTFGVIEDGGLQFRNKAFGVTVRKPEGWRWGWVFPTPMPELLVFQAGTADGTIEVVCEAYSSSRNYMFGTRSVKATELKPFFEALEKQVASRHADTTRVPAFKVMRQARKQDTVTLSGLRKSDQRKIDLQITVGQVGQTVYRLEIVAAQGTFKTAKKEIEDLLKTIRFERD